ncbi:MAG: CRISPR-associated helicase Cas3' [Ruminococcus sp.]|nr:CRISPR-associated helicase Cas3' [Ruminococcus sp.]
MININIIAAKSDRNNKTRWLPYRIHAIDTAGIMENLYDEWLPMSLQRYISKNLNPTIYDINESDYITKKFCQLIGLIHDIGKITPAFQKKITHNIENHTEMLLNNGIEISKISEYSKSPHNIAGQVILKEFGFSNEIASIVGSHHGKIVQNYRNQLSIYSSNYFGYKSKQEQEWRSLWSEWIEYSLKETGWNTVDELPKPDVKLQMILIGLLIMSDWIASNTDYFPYIDIDSSISDEKYRSRIEDAWNKLSLTKRWEAENIYNQVEFFKERFKYKPNAIQRTVMDIVSENYESGIYIIEAPMGIGKTEAALAASEILASKFKAGGIYFGLPTQATANGIFGRIRDWAKGCDKENHAIRLAHGTAELNGEYKELFKGKVSDLEDESIIVHEWFEGRKQALLAEFVIATVDQFLLASLKQKHVMLRHLGLAGKIVIIDECHAYDAYMNIYLDHTLTWMGAYSVPVIILSATLPTQRRNEMIKAYLNQRKEIFISDKSESLAYPVITWTSEKTVRQKSVDSDTPDKHIIVTEINESEIISTLSEKLSGGGCSAVIVNTVDYAQQLSKKISEEMPNFEVMCFHSRFTATDRAEIEKKLIERTGKKSGYDDRNNLIVVGTQVIEQSLDVDFDFMITEICPMDLLLQRAGRLQRHERKRPEKLKNAEIAIFCSAESKSNSIYSEWILKRTEKYLPDKFIIPKCISYLVNRVYNEPENDEERNCKEWKEFERIRKDKEVKAKKYCIKSNMLDSRYCSLDKLINDDAGNSIEAEASVRDTDETIEVILMQKKSDNKCCLYLSDSLTEFDTTVAISYEEAKLIAMQRLKLPLYFSEKCHFNDTVKALDVMPENWRLSKWLKGELLLLTDENSEAELTGKKLFYGKIRGLEIIV